MDPAEAELMVRLSYSSMASLGILAVEITIIFGADIWRKGWRHSFNFLNIVLGLNVMGSMILLINQILDAYHVHPLNLSFMIDGIGAGITLVGYVFFLYGRSSSIIDDQHIQRVVYTVAIVAAISCIVSVIAGYFGWKINGDILVSDLGYVIMMMSILYFDLYFTRIFVRQLRQARDLLGVRDRELQYVSKMGLTILGISFSILISLIITSVLSGYYRRIFGVLSNHLSTGMSHVVFYTKIVRPFRRSVHKYGLKSGRTSSFKGDRQVAIQSGRFSSSKGDRQTTTSETIASTDV